MFMCLMHDDSVPLYHFCFKVHGGNTCMMVLYKFALVLIFVVTMKP